MKKLFLFLTLILGCVTFSSAQSRVAVYVDGNIDDFHKDLINAKATSRISKTRGLLAVERNDDFLRAIRDEIDYQVSGEVRTDQIAAIGKRYGAHYVAVFIAKQNC